MAFSLRKPTSDEIHCDDMAALRQRRQHRPEIALNGRARTDSMQHQHREAAAAFPVMNADAFDLGELALQHENAPRRRRVRQIGLKPRSSSTSISIGLLPLSPWARRSVVS